jgi:ABC-type phosphate/phosphonate transport system substrate-binding protein
MTLLLAALAGAAAAQQAASPAFVLGVLPNVSARVIATTYQPMQAYLQRELGRPVEVATAQDFRAAFGVGYDDKTIATVDADGVAMAAIQGLHQLMKEKDSTIAGQAARISGLEFELQRIKAALGLK